ncbi:MAG: GFA family protein [Alphaproteobacteria bacterium]
MKVRGSCHCEAIKFEADIDPGKVSVCHCTDCQKLTGTAFRMTVPAMASSVAFLSGTPKIYVKTAASGRQRHHGFCGQCGTPLFSVAAGPDPATYGIRVGTLSQRGKLKPSKQIWLRSALPWLPPLPCQMSFDEEDGD